MTKDEIAFELKNKLIELDSLCDNLKKFGKSMGLSKKCQFEVNLAMDELFTNIVSYGFEDFLDHLVNFKISCRNDELEIRIEDDGIFFDPVTEKPPEIDCLMEACKIGGLGIHLAKQYMDGITYERQKDKNVLRIRKKIVKKENEKKNGGK